MPKPTSSQLNKINKFALEPRSEDNTFVFRSMAIDDQETAYNSMLHENFLKKLSQDAQKGVALQMNHNSRQLPAGRSFDSELMHEHDDSMNKDVCSVYNDFYIDLGRMTESGMSTDDIAKGIEAGTIFDVSIGFNASKWTCNICGNDIRDYMRCPHIAGKTYEVTGEDNVIRNQKCLVIVGEDGQGELLETSLVYAGACNRATIKHEFSNDSVRDSSNGAKLNLVDNFKNIPLNATIYQYYTKDGSVLLTDTAERTNGAEYLKQRSEEQVELDKLLVLLKDTYGVEIDSEETLKTEFAKYVKSEELETVKNELTAKTAELETANTKLAETETALSKKDETIAELTTKNEELTAKAGLGDTYKEDLINKTLETGVRAQGNAFQSELFKNFLSTLSIDQIKDTLAGFEKEVETKFAGAQTTAPKTVEGKDNLSNEVPDKENEPELFSTFVADKAKEYAAENKCSLGEATRLMYKKYSE